MAKVVIKMTTIKYQVVNGAKIIGEKTNKIINNRLGIINGLKMLEMIFERL